MFVDQVLRPLLARYIQELGRQADNCDLSLGLGEASDHGNKVGCHDGPLLLRLAVFGLICRVGGLTPEPGILACDSTLGLSPITSPTCLPCGLHCPPPFALSCLFLLPKSFCWTRHVLFWWLNRCLSVA